jgi:hypothetical protein
MHRIKIKSAPIIMEKRFVIGHAVSTRNEPCRVIFVAHGSAVSQKFLCKFALVKAKPEHNAGMIAVTKDRSPQYLNTTACDLGE